MSESGNVQTGPLGPGKTAPPESRKDYEREADVSLNIPSISDDQMDSILKALADCKAVLPVEVKLPESQGGGGGLSDEQFERGLRVICTAIMTAGILPKNPYEGYEKSVGDLKLSVATRGAMLALKEIMKDGD